MYQSVDFGGHQVRTLFDGVSPDSTRPLPDGDRKARPGDAVLGLQLSAQDAGGLASSDAEYAAEFRHVLEEAVRDPAARRRAGWRLSQRRPRLLRGAGTCGASIIPSRSRPSPSPSSRRPTTKAPSRGDGGAVGRRVHPIPIGQRDLADNFADAIAQSETLCINAHGVAKYLLSRAVRDAGYKVVITGEGSDEMLGGYPHFRRDMLLYNREGQDPDGGQQLLDWLDQHNTVSRGLLLPTARSATVDRVRRVLGYVPSWIETFSSRAVKMRPLLSDAISSAAIGQRKALSADPRRPRCPRSADRTRSAAPVVVSLVEDCYVRLHPDHARRPDGDGALHRGPRAVSRSSRRRGDRARSRSTRRSAA